jgi:hypothetical protein
MYNFNERVNMSVGHGRFNDDLSKCKFALGVKGQPRSCGKSGRHHWFGFATAVVLERLDYSRSSRFRMVGRPDVV